MYIYPDNLRAKATMFLWSLNNLAVIGIGCLVSVFALAQLGLYMPVVATAIYTILTIRFEETTILNFLKYAFAFFIGRQQQFQWRAGR